MITLFLIILSGFIFSDCNNSKSDANIEAVSEVIDNQVVEEEASIINPPNKIDNNTITSNNESVDSGSSIRAQENKDVDQSEPILDVKDKLKIQKEDEIKTSSEIASKNDFIEPGKIISTEPQEKEQVIEQASIQSDLTEAVSKPEEKETINESKVEGKTLKVEDVQTTFNHSQWDMILQANVNGSGKVNYTGIKANYSEFENYTKQLSANAPSASWSANKTKAYWINVYNAYTIKLIIDNYPVKKITDLHGGKPWDQQWIKIGDKTLSLNDVEHKILRPTYNDPRIHFAVNCAAKSCPKVWNRAWTESNIEDALQKLTKEFVTNQSANQISEKKLSLSKIFEWYQEDFGDLISFLNKYSAVKISSNAKIEFNDYNWNLNS